MRTMQPASTAYVHRRQGDCGHLWQGRFCSCTMDETPLWSAIRTVARNPVRARIAARAQDHASSSEAGPRGLRRAPISDADPAGQKAKDTERRLN